MLSPAEERRKRGVEFSIWLSGTDIALIVTDLTQVSSVHVGQGKVSGNGDHHGIASALHPNLSGLCWGVCFSAGKCSTMVFFKSSYAAGFCPDAERALRYMKVLPETLLPGRHRLCCRPLVRWTQPQRSRLRLLGQGTFPGNHEPPNLSGFPERSADSRRLGFHLRTG